MDLASWKQNGNYFTYKGQYQIFYQEAGTGEPLLLLHGFPTSSWDWNKVWNKLRAQRFHLIAPDFIGFGYSDKPRGYAYSILDQADIVEELMEKMGIKQAHVLAHDYGDTVMQELLARDIDRREKGDEGIKYLSVVFLNGGLFPETHLARRIQKLLLSPIGFMLTWFMGKKKFHQSFDEVFGPNTKATQQEIDEFWELITEQKGQHNFHRLIHYMTDRINHRERWVKCLQDSPAPIRVIDGAYDPVSGAHMVARYKELVPNADTVLLENIGHYPQTEAPEAVLKHYWEFLEQIKAR